MSLAPTVITIAVVSCICCYGLMKRTAWMWYLGLIFLYLFAGYFNILFFSAIFNSATYRELAFSIVYLLGGLVLWLPSTLGWIGVRQKFGSGRTR